MGERRSWDEMKRARDGHTSAGPLHPGDPRLGMWPKRTSIGYDADGNVVAEGVATSLDSGEIIYGDSRKAVRWKKTDFGKRLWPAPQPEDSE